MALAPNGVEPMVIRYVRGLLEGRYGAFMVVVNVASTEESPREQSIGARNKMGLLICDP